MAELLFKTNIKCNGCIAKVTPFLDGEKQVSRWKVDLENPERILSVISETISSESVVDLLKKAGYTAVEVK